MVSWISSEASSAPTGLAAAGTAERILGTTSVHKSTPAWGLIIFVLSGGKSKNARPGQEQAFFAFGWNWGQIPGLGGGGTDSDSGPLSILYSTGRGAIAGGKEQRRGTSALVQNENYTAPAVGGRAGGRARAG